MNSKKIGRIKIEIEEIIAVHRPYEIPDRLTIQYLGRALEAMQLAMIDLERRLEILEQEN